MLETLFLIFLLIALCALGALAVLIWPVRRRSARQEQKPWWFDQEPY